MEKGKISIDDAFIDEKEDKYKISDIVVEEEVPEDHVDYQFTFRSVFVGALLGCILGASNIYLSLKVGWSFLGSFFGSIAGFGVVRLLSLLPTKIGGGALGVRETCTIQTAATASAGLTGIFASVVPAMYRLKLLPPLEASWGLLICWLIPASFYGLFFAVPLRSTFILKQSLPFPGPAAVSQVIKNLHKKSVDNASRQLKYMLFPFGFSILYRVFTYFVPFLWDLHIFLWIGNAAKSVAVTSVDSLWGWRIQLTPAFIGCGMMIGFNPSLSFLSGAVLAWGLIGPCLYYLTDEVGDAASIASGMKKTSHAQWNLWVGIVMMLVYSFTELLLNYKIILSGFKGPWNSIRNFIAKKTNSNQVTEEKYVDYDDPAKPHEQVPTWMWVTGVILSLIVNIFVNHFYFGIYTGQTILCAILSFFLSYVGTLVAAQTNINPGGILAKVTQLIFAVLPASSVQASMSSSLMCTGYTSHTVLQAAEMIGDLKTGHDLRASPRYQFYAQALAVIPGIFSAVAMFQLFANAYPCIFSAVPDPTCAFPAPSAAALTSIAKALSGDISKLVPVSCQIACGIAAIISFSAAIVKHYTPKKYVNYVPNFGIVGLAFCIPQPTTPIALTIGASIGSFWFKRNPESYNLLMQSVAAGSIGGEGIGGLIMAVLNIAGVEQKKYATGFACPNNNPAAC